MTALAGAAPGDLEPPRRRNTWPGPLLVILAALAAGPAAAACSDATAELRGDWGEARFTVEVADDPAERAKGLMNRDALGASQGMLFVYEKPQRTSFWMRNTLIPLDIIFIGPEGRVLKVHENAVPLDETPIDGGDGVQYVLEINGGLAERIGIAAGSELRHPSIGREAAWPCP